MGAVFALMGAFVNWFPLISGMTINPILLKTQFLVMFIGVNLTFFSDAFFGISWHTPAILRLPRFLCRMKFHFYDFVHFYLMRNLS